MQLQTELHTKNAELRLSLHKSLTKPIRDGCQVGGCVFAKSKTHPERTSLVFDLCSRNIIPYPAAACKPSRYVFSSIVRYSMIQYEQKKAGGKPMVTDNEKTAPRRKTEDGSGAAQGRKPHQRLKAYLVLQILQKKTDEKQPMKRLSMLQSLQNFSAKL